MPNTKIMDKTILMSEPEKASAAFEARIRDSIAARSMVFTASKNDVDEMVALTEKIVKELTGGTIIVETTKELVNEGDSGYLRYVLTFVDEKKIQDGTRWHRHEFVRLDVSFGHYWINTKYERPNQTARGRCKDRAALTALFESLLKQDNVLTLHYSEQKGKKK